VAVQASEKVPENVTVIARGMSGQLDATKDMRGASGGGRWRKSGTTPHRCTSRDCSQILRAARGIEAMNGKMDALSGTPTVRTRAESDLGRDPLWNRCCGIRSADDADAGVRANVIPGRRAT